LLTRLLCLLALGVVAVPPGASAQLKSDEPIFRRFNAPPSRSESRMRMFEFPLALRPQTDPDAEVHENKGIGYLVAVQPFNRVFASVGFNFARLSWKPTDPTINRVEVKQLDVFQSVNFTIGRRFVIDFGLGIGVLDGLVTKGDGTFEHNLVPYIPLRLGLSLILWNKVFVALRGVGTPFFGEGHEVGHSRLLLGLGWSY
jgi:hypothetical protein